MARPQRAGWLQHEPFDDSGDLDAAPGAYKGEDSAPPFTFRRARQNMVWIYGVGLVFLVFSVGSLVDSDPHGVEWVIRIGNVAAIAICYVLTAWACDLSLRQRWAFVLGFNALLLATFPFMGWGFIYYGIYVSIMLSTLIPWRHARIAILLVSVIIMTIALLTQEWAALSIGLTGLFVGWATGAGIERGRISRQLDRSRQQVSVLAVAAERERIGRDLHDILGHSLTAISIKAGLAAKLVDHDRAAARAEISDIEEIARQALGDVRSTASGYREVRVPIEIASARSVLMAAGIQAQTPSALEPMSEEVSELFGYLVREAVTNVVRHSEAGTCTITVSAGRVTVSDDGRGFTMSRTTCGSGLEGLSQRFERAGGRLVVSSRPGVGTEVRGELQADLSASAARGDRGAGTPDGLRRAERTAAVESEGPVAQPGPVAPSTPVAPR